MAQHWLLATLVATALALVPPATTAPGLTKLSAYVPSGMSAAEWKKIQDKEKQQRTGKNFGAGGARGFKSRSFNSFVDAMERGEATHLFAVNPDEVRKGNIALKDVPYMQRGGSWDNSDLKGKKGWMKTGFGMTAFNDGKAKEVKANKYDAQYNGKKPSVSIWGDGGSLDWTGRGARGTGGDTVGARATRNGISNDQQMWRDAGALGKKDIAKMAKRGSQANINKPEKKFFGLF